MVCPWRAPLNPGRAPALLLLPHHQDHSRAAGSCNGPKMVYRSGCKSIAAHMILEGAKWRQVSWRRGTKGRLSARFAAMRVRIAEGAPQRIGSMGSQHMPGEEAWMVGDLRSNGERKYYLSSLPPIRRSRSWPLPSRPAGSVSRPISNKEELGLDHFEGRSWTGLRRYALITMIAYAFLQSRRLAAAGRE